MTFQTILPNKHMPQAGFDPPVVKDDLCEHYHRFTPLATTAGFISKLFK